MKTYTSTDASGRRTLTRKGVTISGPEGTQSITLPTEVEATAIWLEWTLR